VGGVLYWKIGSNVGGRKGNLSQIYVFGTGVKTIIFGEKNYHEYTKECSGSLLGEVTERKQKGEET